MANPETCLCACQTSGRPGPPWAHRDGLPVVTLPLVSPQQFGIWLDSSSPEQTVPYLWSEDTPASKPRSGLLLSFRTQMSSWALVLEEGTLPPNSPWFLKVVFQFKT